MIEDIDEVLFDKVLNLNVKGVYGVIKFCLLIMKEQGSGVIVVMGLDQFFIGKCNLFVYGVSKGVLVFMVKIIVFDYVFYNICVNVVCLGIIEIFLFYNVIDNYVVCFGVDKNEVVVEEVVV